MPAIAYRRPRDTTYITLSTLLLGVFAIAFFPRLLALLGAPSIVNFLHLPLVPLLALVAIANSKVAQPKQLRAISGVLIGVAVLFGAMLFSAVANQAGLINVLLNMALLGEPAFLLIAFLCIQPSLRNFLKLQKWLVRFGFANLILAYLQAFIIIPFFRGALPATTLGSADLVQGVFFISSGSAPVSASVSLIFGLYYFFHIRTAPTRLRAAVLIAALLQLVIADAKSVVITMAISLILLTLSKAQQVQKMILYAAGIVAAMVVLWWLINNVSLFHAFKGRLDLDQYRLDGYFMQIKLLSVQAITEYQGSSFLHSLFGLGPGHTVSRLGGWVLRDYGGIFNPLGATQHPLSAEVWSRMKEAAWGGRIENISTFFSPFWGWAGIWGDLGIVGVFAYLFLGAQIWSYFCLTSDLARVLMLRIAASGFVLTQIEDPGIMLFTVMVLGLIWQESILKVQWLKTQRHLAAQSLRVQVTTNTLPSPPAPQLTNDRTITVESRSE